MELLSIADDLRAHTWYAELALGLIADVEDYLARWAAFADYLGESVLESGPSA
jgi:hypothetical protein